ncbi:phosphoglycerate mutase-like protein [Pseudoscourfieldia marina]
MVLGIDLHRLLAPLDALVGAISSWADDASWRHRARRRPRHIVLIRHGESEANLDTSLHQSVADHRIALSDKGWEQAREAGAKLRREIAGNGRVVWYCSPLLRTRQTLQGLLEGGGWDASVEDVRQDPRLREQEWGNFQDPEEIRAAMSERHEYGHFYYRFPRGESGADCYDRCDSFVGSLMRAMDAGFGRKKVPTVVSRRRVETVVIVTHGITLRLLATRYLKWTVAQFMPLRNPRNCEAWVLARTPQGTFQLKTTPRRYAQSETKNTDCDDSIQAIKGAKNTKEEIRTRTRTRQNKDIAPAGREE